MKVIVACEFSGVVRDAFIDAGHDAVSCDLLPSESSKGPHIVDDIRNVDLSIYDMMIAHPPCTYLCRSGLRWVKQYKRYDDQKDALDFVRYLYSAPVGKICIENPIGVLSTYIRKPDQIVQPWWFGVGEVKATCLWLQGLPCLKPTSIVAGRNPAVHYAAPGKDRWKVRSRTCVGVAAAMAAQWC